MTVTEELLRYFDMAKLAPENNTTLGEKEQSIQAGALENMLFLMENRAWDDEKLTAYMLDHSSPECVERMAFHLHQTLDQRPYQAGTFEAYLYLNNSVFNSETVPWYEANGNQLGLLREDYCLECVKYARCCLEGYLLQFAPGALLPAKECSSDNQGQDAPETTLEIEMLEALQASKGMTH